MLKIGDLLNKFKRTAASDEGSKPENEESTHSVKMVRNWYEERYDNITVQCNLLFVLLLILLCLSIVSI